MVAAKPRNGGQGPALRPVPQWLVEEVEGHELLKAEVRVVHEQAGYALLGRFGQVIKVTEKTHKLTKDKKLRCFPSSRR